MKSWYGGVSKGTWKSLGHNRFQIKMHDVYQKDHYTIWARVNGNQLHTYANAKSSKYRWYADTSVKQPDMTYSDYMTHYNQADESAAEYKKSQEEAKQESTDQKSDDTQNETANSATTDTQTDSSQSADQSTWKFHSGQEAVQYFEQKTGKTGITLTGGNFGMSDHPYSALQDNDGHIYFIYAEDGRIVDGDDENW